MKKSFHVFFLFTLVAFFATMANAGQVTLTPDQAGDYVNMPYTRNTEVIDTLDLRGVQGVTTFKVYDDGGKEGNYSDVSNAYLVIIAPDGYLFSVSGEIDTQDDWDHLIIKDGGSDGNTLLTQSGTDTDIGTVLSSGGVVTFYFHSDGGTNQSGLDLTVTLVDASSVYAVTVNSVNGGVVELENGKTSAEVGETVTLTASASSGFILNWIEVKGTEDNNPVNVSGGQWYSGSNTASFVMPNKPVTVTPQFTDNPTAEGGLSINIPTDGSDLIVGVPEGVSSFKVDVEDGEPAFGAYAGRLEMTAPEGFLFQVSGLSGQIVGYVLQIEELENSGGNGGTCLWGPRNGCPADETILSTGRIIRLNLQYAVPFELTVKLVDATKEYAVNVATGVIGGSIVSDKNSAKTGEKVKLTVSPTENYLLDHVGVVDSNGSAIQAPLLSWFTADTATLRMPPTHITVTPVFTSDFRNFSINLPSKEGDQLEAYIPAEVSSFKVYDDGGKDGDYTVGTWSTLVLNAPEGSAFRITGTVSTGSAGDQFYIYDGKMSGYSMGETLLGPISGDNQDIGTVYSMGRVVTLMFSAEVGDGDGLDLTVELVDASIGHTIAIDNDIDCGSVIAEGLENVLLGQTITLTAVPGTGCLLQEILVTDENGQRQKVNGGSWTTSNTATFTMPYSDVDVTATFTNALTADGGLYVTMPEDRYNVKTVNIPGEVLSLKVFDHAGENASSSLGYGEEKLTLVAPVGYRLQVEGDVTAKLTIRDGDASASVVLTVDYVSGMSPSKVNSLLSTGNTLTFGLSGSMYSVMASPADLDLTVSLVKTTQYAAVTVEQVGTKTTAVIDGAYNESGTISIPSDIPVNEVIFNRTFSTGVYSTIVLPFDVYAKKVDGLAQVLEFAGVGPNEETGVKEAKVTEIWCDTCSSLNNALLTAYTPYIVKLDETSLVFNGGVTLVATKESVVRKGNWELRGALSKIEWNEGHSDIGRVYGFAGENTATVSVGQFVKVSAGARIRPLRAYMAYDPEGNSLNKSTRYNFDAEPQPDYMNVVIVSRDASGQEHKKVIGGINTRTGEFKMLQDYDLKGRKLMNAQQKARGAYYGKKKIVK